MPRVPITSMGYEKLKSELQRLQRTERPSVIKAIEEARAHGDISENAEFEAAIQRGAESQRAPGARDERRQVVQRLLDEAEGEEKSSLDAW